MANIRYRLFGEELVESQGMMMARVFKTLLNRHLEKMPEAIKLFSCLTPTDYHQDLEALRSAKSIFLNKQTFQVGTQTVCIGTSCNLPEKRKLITRLFALCGDDKDQFEILDINVTEEGSSSRAKQAKKANRHGISYRLFDKIEHSTQADMLYHVMSEILLQKPNLVDWAAANLNCISKTDYTREENQFNMPSTFHNCRPLEVDGQLLWIATAYGLKQKQHYIDRLLQKAGFPKDVFEVYSDSRMSLLWDWQKEMVEAVLDRLSTADQNGGLLGIISLPAGCGKSRILGEITHQLLKPRMNWSVLILTSSVRIADQYELALKELLGGFCPVELAASRNDLEMKSKQQGIVLISTAQKLLFQGKDSVSSLPLPEVPPYSEFSHLLVVVEEASYHYFSRTYIDMRCRFPNAAFLGVTHDPTPSRQLEKCFGPLLYRYSWADACEDGFLKPFEYREVIFQRSEVEFGQQYRINGFFSMERVCEIAKWIAIEECDKSRCALLVCQNHEIAAQYYDLLLPILKSERLRTCLVSDVPGLRRHMSGYTVPEQSYWNGEYFSGLVIACTPSFVNRPFHRIYLDRNLNQFEMMNICSMLMREIELDQKKGVLVSFYPIRHRLEDFLEMYIPTADVPAWSHDSLESFQESITRSLKSRQYEAIEATLHRMHRFYPVDEERLAAQLNFLYPQSMERSQRRQYWEHHQKRLAWQSDLWCLLSQDSSLKWEERHTLSSPVLEDAEEEKESPLVPASASTGTPQQRGAQFELSVKRLLRFLFELDDDGPLDSLRVQGSGLQFGFDIVLKYRDHSGIEITCVIECKNYSSDIQPKDISDKLIARQMAGTKVDHWILISPHTKVNNRLREMAEAWKGTDYWYPILDVQFWTPDEGVQDLFGLFPEVYQNIYDVTEENDPSRWSVEKKDRIAAHWKQKLAHVPHLPQKWKTYLRKPEYLLTERETDLKTARSYDQLYCCRAPMRLLDQDELPIEGLAEEYFFKWLQKPEKNCALLLGDFGDGKSFFTYVLARRLAEEFWNSPEAGWIPLRLSLRELGDHRVGFRQVFKNRLEEFCDGIQSWNQVRERYKFLIILDGLDEMSLGMNDTAVLDNLTILEELIEQFNGYKLLVTSRKMVIYSDKVRNRILSVLEKPEIVHLAPIARRDCIDFLERLADTPARKKRLLKIRHTHDLLGLAEKPLFLSMILAQMDSDDIQANDMFGIYHDHVQKVLDRKFYYQLAMADDHTSKETVCRNLFTLLEELAICMQFSGKDSVSLEEFKKCVPMNSMVRLLWSYVDDTDAQQEEDANNRVSNRSLLKYDSIHPENRLFCHRSMKEYFTACGIARKLCENRDFMRELLMKSCLGYEICLFAGKAFQKMSAEQRKLVQRNLTEFAHETRGMRNDPQRKNFANLGANSVNLLHYGKFGLPGEDWTGLVLDNAALSGAELSGKNFSHCSMRFAHLDNADLTGCDLRGCDFTGVQFEKSGQLRAFILNTRRSILLAYYQDGKLREWQIGSGDTQTIAQFEPKKRVRLISDSEGQEGAVFPERLQFWNHRMKNLSLAGHITLRQGTQLLDVGHTSALVRQGHRVFLLKIDGCEILQQWEFSGTTFYAVLLSEQAFVIWSEEQFLTLVNASGDPYCSCLALHDGQVTSLNVDTITQKEKRIVLGYEDGRIKCFTAICGEDSGVWSIGTVVNRLRCDSQIVDAAFYGSQELYVGTSSGVITQYHVNDLGELESDKIYQLELKCVGAQIEGVQPLEQYEILRRAAMS